MTPKISASLAVPSSPEGVLNRFASPLVKEKKPFESFILNDISFSLQPEIIAAQRLIHLNSIEEKEFSSQL